MERFSCRRGRRSLPCRCPALLTSACEGLRGVRPPVDGCFFEHWRSLASGWSVAQMKIAMLGHRQIPSRKGGIEIVVNELATRMAAQGYQVTCYNRGWRPGRKNAGDCQGVRLKYVWTMRGKGLSALTASVSASFCAAFGNYDVVHYHAEGPCAMLWLPKLRGKRCIATVHGLDHRRAKWGPLGRAYLLLGERVAVRWADEIIVLSRSAQDYFRKTYGRETVLIPNGVDRLKAVSPCLIRERYGLERGEYILYLGRLVPEKGVQYLLDAYRQLHTDKKLVIAGDSCDTKCFVRRLKRSVRGEENILFTGFVEQELLAELYSNAYLYVLPSDLEGMSISLLEAMSYGCCCLVSDIDECASVVEDHAMVFHWGNVEDLREKLQCLCDRPELVQRYREAASDFICARYQWDDVVRRTLAVYAGQQ